MSVEVSIITPVFNASKTIRDTFLSIKEQTFSNWEWILIDDCSTDDTLRVLESFAEEDKRIIIIKSDANGGAAVARNKGIEKARGKLIAFIDADDLWNKEKLDKQLRFMKDNDFAISCTDYEVSVDGNVKPYISKNAIFNYKDILKANNVGCSTVIYDTSKLGKKFMPLDAPKREDHAMWLDITKEGTPIYKLEELLATYLMSKGSVSSKRLKMFKYQYILYRKHEHFNPLKSFHLTFWLALRRIFKKYR